MVVGCELNEVLCVRCGGRGAGEEQKYKPDSVPDPVQGFWCPDSLFLGHSWDIGGGTEFSR